MIKRLFQHVLRVATLMATCVCVALADEEDIHIFAASSLTGALDVFVDEFEIDADIKLTYAASSNLVRQIESGAPADLVILAHPQWADQLVQTDLFSQPIDWLTTPLVLVAPEDGLKTLAGIEDSQRIAIGDPAHVPLGIYTRQALQSLGLWEVLTPKIIAAHNAGHVARLILSDAVDAAIVYQAQAKRLKGLKVIYQFAAADHDPVIYQLFTIQGEAQDLLDLKEALLSEKAQTYFETQGFAFISGELP